MCAKQYAFAIFFFFSVATGNNSRTREVRLHESIDTNGVTKSVSMMKNYVHAGAVITWGGNGLPIVVFPLDTNGAIHGTYVTYFPSGQLKEVREMFHGRRHGWDIEYNESGEIISKLFYSYGSLIGEDSVHTAAKDPIPLDTANNKFTPSKSKR